MQFVKFAFVGAIGTALHYAVLIFLVSAMHADPAVGSMTGAVCGAAINYWLNRRFTFDSNRAHVEAMPRFFLIAGIGVLINGMIVKTLTASSVNYLVSQVVATLVILGINFILSKLWIFRQRR